LKTEEILGLVNVIFYTLHIVIFTILAYRQNKNGGIKSALLVLIFLFVLFFIALQVGGFIAGAFFIGKEMTSKLKAIHDTLVIFISTIIESPVWFIFLKRKKEQDETENNSTNSAR
jgi:hypothetical protein